MYFILKMEKHVYGAGDRGDIFRISYVNGGYYLQSVLGFIWESAVFSGGGDEICGDMEMCR